LLGCRSSQLADAVSLSPSELIPSGSSIVLMGLLDRFCELDAPVVL
jgi:hypothetical protein